MRRAMSCVRWWAVGPSVKPLILPQGANLVCTDSNVTEATAQSFS